MLDKIPGFGPSEHRDVIHDVRLSGWDKPRSHHSSEKLLRIGLGMIWAILDKKSLSSAERIMNLAPVMGHTSPSRLNTWTKILSELRQDCMAQKHARTLRAARFRLPNLPSWQAWRKSSSVSSSTKSIADCGELDPNSRPWPPGFITMIASRVNSLRSQWEYIHTIPRRVKYSEAISNTGPKPALSISTPEKRTMEELMKETL